ncbi:PPOX class F420-dependent oxidoreductase [Parafrigoribacterium mesophilum]|uniref:PPOX class F420-dependent oxidoreductase n=1 Tax=Parafrigoribacterium mesophilum TaxID=433646 RepID=UPI0031FC0F33
MTEIPASHRAILEQATIAHLATLRPDGRIQLNDMWFLFDGENIRFTHTNKRVKFRNLQLNPAMTLSVTDVHDRYRFVELRGRLSEVIDDPTGSFYQVLDRRYGAGHDSPAPADAADRVILVMAIDVVRVR